MNSLMIISKLNDGFEIPFIYECQTIEKAQEIIQETINLGAEIVEVVLR